MSVIRDKEESIISYPKISILNKDLCLPEVRQR